MATVPSEVLDEEEVASFSLKTSDEIYQQFPDSFKIVFCFLVFLCLFVF